MNPASTSRSTFLGIELLHFLLSYSPEYLQGLLTHVPQTRQIEAHPLARSQEEIAAQAQPARQVAYDLGADFHAEINQHVLAKYDVLQVRRIGRRLNQVEGEEVDHGFHCIRHLVRAV